MIYLLSIAVAALAAYTFILGQRVKSAQRRTEQLTDRLYSWGSETRTLIDEMRKQIRRLDFEIKRRAGEIEISPEARVSDLLLLHPRMKEVLDGLQQGGCGSGGCSSGSPETLAATAATVGASIDAVLAEIQRFLQDPDGYQPARTTSSPGLIQIQIPERAVHP